MNHARRHFASNLCFSQVNAVRDAFLRCANLPVTPGRHIAVGRTCGLGRSTSHAEHLASSFQAVGRRCHLLQPSQSWPALRRRLPLLVASCGIGAVLLQASHAPVTPAQAHCQTPHLPSQPQNPEDASVWESLKFAAHMCLRTTVLLSILVPLLVIFPFADLHPYGRRAWLLLLQHSLKYCGPAWAKWGQWASARPDLLPADVRQVLETLHTAVPAHSAAASRAVLQRSLPLPFDEVFERFEWEPIASGAIAQVHRAWLTPPVADLCGVSPDEVHTQHAPQDAPNVHRIIATTRVQHGEGGTAALTHAQPGSPAHPRQYDPPRTLFASHSG